MLLRTTIITVLLGACSGGGDDSSLYLTGTEEGALTSPSGVLSCAGHKELICHIPPGNPANEHTICVGKPAVEPHVTHHGDHIGACAVEPTPPSTDPPPPDDGSGSDGTDADPVLQ
jgi:hypothetical protein